VRTYGRRAAGRAKKTKEEKNERMADRRRTKIVDSY
jgi:hypothetical protein